jgi:hypothetical protein
MEQGFRNPATVAVPSILTAAFFTDGLRNGTIVWIFRDN